MTKPERGPPNDLTAGQVLTRLARTYLAPHWGSLSISLVCAAAAAGLTIWITQLMRPAINGMIGKQGFEATVVIALTVAAAGVARGVVQAVQLRMVNRIGHSVVGDIQVDLIDRLVRADLARLRGVHTGSHVSSLLYDASLVREAVTSGAVNWVQQILIVAGLAIYMVWIDVGLTAIVIIAAPLSIMTIRSFSHHTSRAASNAMSETSNLSTAILESLDGIKVVKIDNQERFERDRVETVIRRRQRYLVKGSNAKGLGVPATETLATLMTAAILIYADWRTQSGGLSVGAFTSFLIAMALASQGVRQLANMQTLLAEALPAGRRLFKALDIEPTIVDSPSATALPKGQAHVRLESVSFSYGADLPALERVSLEARRGETVALVGPSGGGKTTVLNLIARFFDPTSGAVTIDGHDLRGVTMASLREQIALVTQEPFLFDDTLRANISYARPDATDEQVEAAARAAAAHDFIMALPQGYLTTTGEAGARLSGGQRQRIAIARAFLKDAPILLLDEATSALDTESEIQVQAALDRLMSGRTTMLIAHRLSTVRGASRIYVVDHGRIVETGDHQSLVRLGGLYARLASSQNL